MLYTFNELMQKVNEDENGTGAVFYYKDGTVLRRFYENMSGSLGIDRASNEFQELFNADKVYKVIYYWKGKTGLATVGERIKVHFYDPTTHKEIHTRQDGEIYKVYSKDGRAGIDYAGEFHPFSHFATGTGTVAFEIVA